MNKNIIGGVCSWMSGPRITKSCELAVYVNDAVVSAQSINLSREICIDGMSGFQSTRIKTSILASNGKDIVDAEVSRWHSNRGNERGVGQGRIDTMVCRIGEGLKFYETRD